MDGTQHHSPRKDSSVRSTLQKHDGNKFAALVQQVMLLERNGSKLRVTVNFRRDSDERPVVFKSDGQRFSQPFTVKFNQDETYTVQICLEPPLPVESFVLHEEKIDLDEIIVKDATGTPGSPLYHGKWKPQAFERTRRNHREQLKIVIHLKNHGTFLALLQAKFYPIEEVTHSTWGETLNAAVFECEISRSYSDTITLQKQFLI